MIDLLNFRKNYFSQNGEDGIIEFILHNLKIEIGHFVEFGAADGKICSNTWNLVDKNWFGLYIEPRKEYFEKCVYNTIDFPRIKSLQEFVIDSGQNSLDEILLRFNIPKNFEILSIDVDGEDYNIWKNLKNYKPKIVIIEINSAIPEGIYQINNPPNQICTSFSSMVELGISKGYKPICHTGNLIFVDSDIEFPSVNFYMLTDWIGRFKNPYNLTN
jgi:hypothetical protein